MSLAAFLLLACAQTDAPAHEPFSQADLETMVVELLTVVPENPDYQYPIEMRLLEQDVKNAWTFLRADEATGALIPQLELFRGLCNLAENDPRLIRAVLAHELAHVACGHSMTGFPQADLSSNYTRQTEREADLEAAKYLEALGYPRQDMVDMLHMLHRMVRDFQVPWLMNVTSDHASPAARAAEVMPTDATLAVIAKFEIGLAYMECRRYQAAIGFFDQAVALEPALDEARLNAASAALQHYYDSLPTGVQSAWLRPEFGPHIQDALLGAKGFEVSDQDLTNYQAALDRIAALPGSLYPSMQLFLTATAGVLHPQGNVEAIGAGVAILQEMLQSELYFDLWEVERKRQTYANNLALGLARLDRPEEAAAVLFTELEDEDFPLPAAAENLARLPMDAYDERQAAFARDLLLTFLRFTASSAPGAEEAKKAVRTLTRLHGLPDAAAEPPLPLTYCAVASMHVAGREIGLFEEFGQLNALLGEIPSGGTVSDRFGDFYYLMWKEQQVMALAERNRLVKLTSYLPGSWLELRPQRESGLRDPFRIEVGMSEDDFYALLEPAGGSSELGVQFLYLFSARSFVDAEGNAQEEETWTVYPTLNFAVLIRDGAVRGISVTPVTVPEQE